MENLVLESKTENRKCPKCLKTKSIDRFYIRHENGKRRSQCKDCEILYARQKNEKLKRYNICIRCKKEKADAGLKTCSKCREKFNQYYRENGQNYLKNLKQNNPKEYERRRKLAVKRASIYQQTGKHKQWVKSYNNKIKNIVFAHYGNQCICCGEKILEFLTLDHIENNGKEHRKKLTHRGNHIYKWLLKNNFPNDFKLQILCWNCNMGRQLNSGICPHKKENNGVQVNRSCPGI